MNIHWKNRWWNWNSSPSDIWYKKPTYWKRPWCWGKLQAGEEGGDRGRDDWMALSTQWTWVWANSGDSEGQGSLAGCSPWDHKVLDVTEWLNSKNQLQAEQHVRRHTKWSRGGQNRPFLRVADLTGSARRASPTNSTPSPRLTYQISSVPSLRKRKRGDGGEVPFPLFLGTKSPQ